MVAFVDESVTVWHKLIPFVGQSHKKPPLTLFMISNQFVHLVPTFCKLAQDLGSALCCDQCFWNGSPTQQISSTSTSVAFAMRIEYLLVPAFKLYTSHRLLEHFCRHFTWQAATVPIAYQALSKMGFRQADLNLSLLHHVQYSHWFLAACSLQLRRSISIRAWLFYKLHSVLALLQHHRPHGFWVKNHCSCLNST